MTVGRTQTGSVSSTHAGIKVVSTLSACGRRPSLNSPFAQKACSLVGPTLPEDCIDQAPSVHRLPIRALAFYPACFNAADGDVFLESYICLELQLLITQYYSLTQAEL